MSYQNEFIQIIKIDNFFGFLFSDFGVDIFSRTLAIHS